MEPGAGQHGTRLPASSRVPSCRAARVSFVCLASPQEARRWHCPVARPWIPAKASPDVGVQAGPPSPAQQRQEAPGRERAGPRLSPKCGGRTQRIVGVGGWPSGLLRLRGEGSVRGGGGMGDGGWRPAGSPSPLQWPSQARRPSATLFQNSPSTHLLSPCSCLSQAPRPPLRPQAKGRSHRQ